MQSVLIGKGDSYALGMEQEAETFDDLKKHLGLQSDVPLSPAFQVQAQNFIAEQQSTIQAEFTRTTKHLSDVYKKDAELMRGITP